MRAAERETSLRNLWKPVKAKVKHWNITKSLKYYQMQKTPRMFSFLFQLPCNKWGDIIYVFSEFSEMHEICPLSCPLCPLGTKFRICIFLEPTLRSETLKTKLWKQYFTSCIFNMERKLQSWNSKTEPTLCKSVKVESNVKEQLRVRKYRCKCTRAAGRIEISLWKWD